MKILSSRDIASLLQPLELLAAVENALRIYAEGRAVVPDRAHIDFGANTLLTMPAADERFVGIKLATVVPDNATRQLPVTGGLMTLFDAETGVPLAILDAATLTAQRTGAVGAVGVQHMTPEDLSTVGIVGAGVQGTWQAIFACAVRPIEVVHFVARSDASAERFVSNVSPRVGRAVRLSRCHDTRELLERSALVITATTSTEPVLPDDPALLAGKHFISVGSFKPDMRELPAAALRLSGHLAIDSEAARHEVGDVIGPVAEGILEPADVFHVAELATGRRSLERSETTAYKTVGMALYDLCAAQAFYRAACERAAGRDIEL